MPTPEWRVRDGRTDEAFTATFGNGRNSLLPIVIYLCGTGLTERYGMRGADVELQVDREGGRNLFFSPFKTAPGQGRI